MQDPEPNRIGTANLMVIAQPAMERMDGDGLVIEGGLRTTGALETVRNWGIGRREPDTTARSYLHAIANDPERVEMAFAPTAA